MLQESVTEYNDTYPIMSEKASASSYTLSDTARWIRSPLWNVWSTVLPIARTVLMKFTESRDFADRELQEARKIAAGAGTGLAASTSVAFMAPTASM